MAIVEKSPSSGTKTNTVFKWFSHMICCLIAIVSFVFACWLAWEQNCFWYECFSVGLLIACGTLIVAEVMRFIIDDFLFGNVSKFNNAK